MRMWVAQPGVLVTQWQSVRYAGITVLGAISIIAAISAMLYVPAATALVQPQLKWPGWSPWLMQGVVKTEFANPTYIEVCLHAWDHDMAQDLTAVDRTIARLPSQRSTGPTIIRLDQPASSLSMQQWRITIISSTCRPGPK
jgi:hypothetical protein